nr:hypothetical protein [Tanacetum cinerariifolium]
MATTLGQQVALNVALVPSQSFAELPFKEEILEFLRFLGHSTQIKTLTDVNVNKLYQPWRSFAAVINKCLTGKCSGIDSLRNTTAYKEYYACATGEATPKPKASARKKKGGSTSSTTPATPIATLTPTTTVVAAPRLSTAAKGKQPARATTPTEPTYIERTKAEQLKIVLRRSRQEMHISQQHGFGTDEGTGSKPRVLDVPSDDSEEELSWNSFDDEDIDEQTKGKDESEGDKTDESDDDDDDQDEAKNTPEESEDDDNNKEDQGLRIGEEERMNEEEEVDELYRDVDINQERGL